MPGRLLQFQLRLCVLGACLMGWAGCRVPGPTVASSEIPPTASPQEPAITAPPTAEPVATAVSYTEEPLGPTAIEELPAPIEPSTQTGDLTLSGAIEFALAANPDLVSASAQLAIADATLERARAEFYPKLGVSEQYGVTNNPVGAFSYQLNQAQLSLAQDFNNPGVIDNFQTQLRLQHRIYAGEQRLHEMHAAKAGVSAAAFNVNTVHNQLVFRVAESYYRLLQARDLAQVRREAVEQVEQHLKIVESRFRNETAVKSDVLTVEVRLAEVREAFISAQNQLQLAWAVLENVAGTRIEQRTLPDAIPAAPWSDHVDESEMAVAEALNLRPEIGALANQRQAAAENAQAAEAGKRMSVDLVADYDVYTGDFRNGNDSFLVGLVFELNLFDGGRTATEVTQSRARIREIEARQRRLVLDIELDVRRAFLQLNDANERLKVATQAIAQAQESLREIEVRYRGQTASVTQLVDAQVALSNARVRRTNAQSDVEIARASLERAVGRLTGIIQP